jgi:predicted ATPase
MCLPIHAQMVLDEIEKKNIAITKVLLQPLLPEHTLSLVQDAFRVSQEQAAPLAKLVQDKTNGNPFFVCQFLRTIVQEKFVVFEYTDRKWKWSMDQLNAVQYMENVVDFMIAKIRKLPEATQKLIQLAACLGNTCIASQLAAIAELPVSDTNKHLATAVAGGFLHQLPQSPPAETWTEETQREIPTPPASDTPGSSSPSLELETLIEPTEKPRKSSTQKFKEHSLPENLSELVIPFPVRTSSPASTPSQHSPTVVEIDGKYKFVHDRVQEAFYVMVDEQERMKVHLKIAHILRSMGVDESQDNLFTVVHHYNLAIDLVLATPLDGNDRQSLIELNYEAACKAKHSNAIEAARGYLLQAQKALPENSLEINYTQTFELLLLLAEVNYVCGDHQGAFKLFDVLLEESVGKKDKARVHILAASCCESAGKYAQCVQNCSSAARLFGVELPDTGTEKLVRETLDEIFVEQRARTKTVVELGNLPFMDEEHELAMQALYTAIAAAFLDTSQGDHHLFYLIAGRMCVFTIQHGVCAFSANAFACFAGALAQYGLPNIYDFGVVAMAMHARIKVNNRIYKLDGL